MNDQSKSSGIAGVLVVLAFVALGFTGYKALNQVAPAVERITVGGTNPDIPSAYLQWGGIAEYRVGSATIASSSVMCSLQGPAATSTLAFASFLPSANGLGAQTFSISTSTTAAASSTPAIVQVNSITVGVPIVWVPGVATTTAIAQVLNVLDSTGLSPYVIKPNEYVNFRIATGTPGTFATYVTGKCQAIFMTLN